MLTETIAFDVPPGEKPKDALAALAELTDEKANAIFARFAKNSTWYDPTLVAYYTFLQEAEENVVKEPRWKPAAEGRRKMFDRFKQLVGMMQRAGVGILAGSDFSSKTGVNPYPVPQPGTDLHAELAYFVQSGLTPMQALQTATLNPAKWFNIQKDYGTVEKGKMADLVLLDANPLENIKNTRKISAVIIGGKLVYQASSTTTPTQSDSK
jgi:imidazolonepropionase-like amidohydrolase